MRPDNRTAGADDAGERTDADPVGDPLGDDDGGVAVDDDPAQVEHNIQQWDSE